MTTFSVDVVIVAYGAEPHLEGVVRGALSSLDVSAAVVVVDNGCTDGSVERVREIGGVEVLTPEGNTGFAGGCLLGQARGRGDYVAFINPDVELDPAALRELCRVASQPDVGITTASLRLMSEPEVLNAVGNDVHFLGMSWCRGFLEPASAYAFEQDVIAASGATMVVRRDVLERVGGFAEEFFAYYEDIELSIRMWQAGLRVVFVPSAVVYHDYFFAANRDKLWLLDRNRLVATLTLYQWRTLIALAPLLLVQEVGLFVVALAQGWFRDRVRAVVSTLHNHRVLRARRRELRARRTRTDGSYIWMFADVLAPRNYPLPRWLMWIQPPLRGYWWLVKTLSR